MTKPTDRPRKHPKPEDATATLEAHNPDEEIANMDREIERLEAETAALEAERAERYRVLAEAKAAELEAKERRQEAFNSWNGAHGAVLTKQDHARCLKRELRELKGNDAPAPGQTKPEPPRPDAIRSAHGPGGGGGDARRLPPELHRGRRRWQIRANGPSRRTTLSGTHCGRGWRRTASASASRTSWGAAPRTPMRATRAHKIDNRLAAGARDPRGPHGNGTRPCARRSTSYRGGIE